MVELIQWAAMLCLIIIGGCLFLEIRFEVIRAMKRKAKIAERLEL